MAEDFVQVAPDSTGAKIHTISRVIGANTVEEQVVLLGDERDVKFRGRVNTFRIPGRAGTAGQKLLSIYNADASVIVAVERVMIDVAFTVVKAVTVLPPTIRVSRFTAAHTNGTAHTPAAMDTALTQDTDVTIRGDASADGTGSGTTLTVTIPANSGLSQEFAPRYMGGAGTNPMIEIMDRTTFFEGEPDVILRQNQGLCLHLDYTLATQNPTTDMWLATIDWTEYTVP